MKIAIEILTVMALVAVVLTGVVLINFGLCNV